MSGNDDVTIRVKRDTWKRLNGRKGPGDSFDDVIRELLNESDEGNEGNPKTRTMAMAD